MEELLAKIKDIIAKLVAFIKDLLAKVTGGEDETAA